MPDTDPTPTPPTPAPFGGKYKWLAVVLTFAATVLTMLATWLNGGSVNQQYGWHYDAAKVAQIVSSLRRPLFADAGADIVGSWDGKTTVLLSDAAKKALGGHIPTQYQTRGTCVSRAYTAAENYLQAVAKAQHENPDYQNASHAAVYGFAKEVMGDIGPQNRSPNNDGLVGAAAAKAVSSLGNLTDDETGDRDDSDTLAIAWAVSGVPQDKRETAKKRLVRTASKVTSFAQAADAIANGYPVVPCSNVGFEPVPAKRDADGFLKARGTWPHAMTYIGVRGGERPGLLCLNSWGDKWVSGPTGGYDIPPGSFWIDKATCERMIGQGDTFALSNFDGFKPRVLDWFVDAPPAQPQRFGWRPELLNRDPKPAGKTLMQPPVLAP